MMRLIGWGALLCVVFAAAALGVVTYALGRQDLQFALYERAAKARHAAPRPSVADAATFRVTVCAATPCALVEAGGLAFVVGAGDGAAANLVALGLLRPEIDGILLSDISLTSIKGLADLRRDTWRAGRRAPLPVYGPPGVERVVDGVNLMMAASDIQENRTRVGPPLAADGAPLSVGQTQLSEGIGGAVLFDSGVVAIRSFPVAGQGAASVYRFDFNNRSLIIAGCAARSTDILAAARGASRAAAMLPASSTKMLEIDRAAAARSGAPSGPAIADPEGQACLSHEDAIAALGESRLTGGLLAPLNPPVIGSPAMRTWRNLVTAPDGMFVAPGEIGDSIDLTGDMPMIRTLKSGAKTPTVAPPADR